MKDSPDLWMLERVKWQFIANPLTLIERFGRFPSDYRQRANVRALMRWFARVGGVPFQSLYFVGMPARGGRTNRPHWHCLISGMRSHTINTGTCFAAMAEWKRLSGAFSQIFVYDHTRDGVGYVLGQNEPARAHATAYETGRINGRFGELIVSPSLLLPYRAQQAMQKAAEGV